MTASCSLSGVRPGFKTCPNCHGEGTEANPPMRKCGICKGTGKVWEKGPTPNRRGAPSEANSASRGPESTGCQTGQGTS